MLIGSLEVLDASEYVHCNHIGVCEFLEVLGVPSRRGQYLNSAKNFLAECDHVLIGKFALFDIYYLQRAIYFNHIHHQSSSNSLQIVLSSRMKS